MTELFPVEVTLATVSGRWDAVGALDSFGQCRTFAAGGNGRGRDARIGWASDLVPARPSSSRTRWSVGGECVPSKGPLKGGPSGRARPPLHATCQKGQKSSEAGHGHGPGHQLGLFAAPEPTIAATDTCQAHCRHGITCDRTHKRASSEPTTHYGADERGMQHEWRNEKGLGICLMQFPD